MSRVEVKPELIQWAIERSGRSPEALGSMLPKIEQWQDGETKPTLRQLEEFAKKTWTPLGYFFLEEPPEEPLPVPDFRTTNDLPVRRPSPNLIDSLYTMQLRQAWMHDYLLDLGNERLEFIGSATPVEDEVSVAYRMRIALGLQDGWASRISTWKDALSELREAAEQAGILVFINGVVGNNTSRPLDPAEFRGFVLNDEYAPLVFLNGADARSAQMFTLAHELAHLWIGKGGLFNLPELQPSSDKVEQFCNTVAAEFLVPATELRSAWQAASRRDQPFHFIARQFKVSPIVAGRRAMDLGLISWSDFLSFYHAYQADERRLEAIRRKKPGGDFYNTQNMRLGRRFGRTVMLAAREGRVSYRDAYSLTGLHGSTYDRYAKILGV